jgi:hypothetical protein
MVGRRSGPHMPTVREDRCSLSKVTPGLSIVGAGMAVVIIAHFGQLEGIREAVMNGYLPYSSTGPAPRVGGVRGWQADILRGES